MATEDNSTTPTGSQALRSLNWNLAASRSTRLPLPRDFYLHSSTTPTHTPSTAPTPTQSKNVASPSLSFKELHELLKLEFTVPRAPPLFHETRVYLGIIEATSRSRGRVKLHLFTDAVLIAEEEEGDRLETIDGAPVPELVPLSSTSYKALSNTLHLPSSTILSLPSPSPPHLTQFLSLLLPPPTQPPTPTPPLWTPDSSLSTCETCHQTRFTTLTRRHHCRDCGALICQKCSRWKVRDGRGEERVCKGCWEGD